MKRLLAVVAFLLMPSITLAMYGEERLPFAELLESKPVKKVLLPDVKLYWAGHATPEFAESSLPDTFSGLSLFFHRDLKFHCTQAFEKALGSMIESAHEKGYDVIAGIRQVMADGSSGDAHTMVCRPGTASTVIQLSAYFARTKELGERLANEEKRLASLLPRNPAKGSVFFPLEPILNSPEAKALLGADIVAQAGFVGPAFANRFGPIDYEGEADIDKAGHESACKQAVLNALEDMVDEAKEKGYDSVINIVSRLDEQFAPPGSDVECQIERKSVRVGLQASLAKRK